METLGFREKISRLTECELALVSEQAHLLVFGEDGNGEGGFRSEKLSGNDAFSEAYKKAKDVLFPATDKKDVPAESAGFISETEKSADATLSLWLCSEICRKMSKAGHPVVASDFFGEEKEPENLRVAYVRNVLSDKIFDLFSKIVPGLSVVYPGSFTAVCEEVYDGRAEFCILPLETSSEGELRGFRLLKEKYELYTVMTAPASADNADGSQNVTRFALFSKFPIKPLIDKNAVSGRFSEYLKIDLSSEDGNSLSYALRAAEISGLRFVRSESVPISWANGRYKNVLTFDVTGKDASPFLLFLENEVPESEPIEIYTDFSEI